MADANMLQGILRWSLAQSDGSGVGEAKPLSEEDRKFLEGAMSQIVDETKRMQVDIAALQMRYPPQSNSQPSHDELLAAQRRIHRIMECIRVTAKYKFDDETDDSQISELVPEATLQQSIYDNQVAALEELEDRVLSIDNSIDSVTLGILPAFIDLLSNRPNNQTYEQSLNLRWRICNVLATITQNNPRTQEAANESGIITVLLNMLHSLNRFSPNKQSSDQSDNIDSLESKVIVKTLYSLASMCRDSELNSNFLVANGGVEMVIKVLVSLNANPQLPLLAQMATKSLSLMRTLVGVNRTALEIAEKCDLWSSAAAFIGHDDVNLRDESMRTIAALVRHSHHLPPDAVRQRILDRIKAVAASTEEDYQMICENEMNSAEAALKVPDQTDDQSTVSSLLNSEPVIMSLPAPSS